MPPTNAGNSSSSSSNSAGAGRTNKNNAASKPVVNKTRKAFMDTIGTAFEANTLSSQSSPAPPSNASPRSTNARSTSAAIKNASTNARKTNAVKQNARPGQNAATNSKNANNTNAVKLNARPGQNASNNAMKTNAAKRNTRPGQNASTTPSGHNAKNAGRNSVRTPDPKMKDSEEVRDCKTRVRLAASHVDCKNDDCPLKKKCGRLDEFEGIDLVGSADWPLDGSMEWARIKGNYLDQGDPKRKAAFRAGLDCIRRTLYEDYPDYRACKENPGGISGTYEEPPKAGKKKQNANSNAAPPKKGKPEGGLRGFLGI